MIGAEEIRGGTCDERGKKPSQNQLKRLFFVFKKQVDIYLTAGQEPDFYRVYNLRPAFIEPNLYELERQTLLHGLKATNKTSV